jgi:xanthine dehydrogenase accessory factor
MSFDLAQLRGAVARHGRVGRIVVVGHKGSAPREAGTSMLVWDTGQSGTIGGGALEFEAVAALRARLHDDAPFVERVPLGPARGQCCGGAVVLVHEVFDAAALAQIENGARYLRRVEGHAEKPLSIERAEARGRNGTGTAGLVFDAGWLSEPMSVARVPVWIYGAGHVGRAIAEVLAPLSELDITWVDTGPERFPQRPPEGVRVLPAKDIATAARLAPPEAHHLILTYSHALDLALCHALLGQQAASIGLIGSATKWVRFQRRLRALGHSDAQIARITCPIGDPRLGKEPQAIALGVASALILSLRAEGASTDKGQATA